MLFGTPFGLTPTPAVLQQTVALALHGITKVLHFQDDVTIGSDIEAQHLSEVIAAVDALSAANLRLRAAKCQFFRTTLRVLGHVLSANGLRFDRRKLIAIPTAPLGTNKSLQRFLGLTNYFRNFFPHHATLTAPLELLHHIEKISESAWNGAPAAAYEAIVKVLNQAPMLSLPDFKRQFSVAIDASATGLGAVMYKLRNISADDIIDNRLWIVFAARALQPAEPQVSL